MIEQYLDASTAHITRDEMDSISDWVTRVIVHQYGAWISVPDELDELLEDVNDDYMPNMQNVVRYAADRHCMWVYLDADADAVPDLPTHDW